MNRATLYRLATAGILVLLSGCAEVQPWERGILAKPQMALEPNPALRELREHNYGSREALSSGGTSGNGGGCGCY